MRENMAAHGTSSFALLRRSMATLRQAREHEMCHSLLCMGDEQRRGPGQPWLLLFFRTFSNVSKSVVCICINDRVVFCLLLLWDYVLWQSCHYWLLR